jgi:hypothetical protein
MAAEIVVGEEIPTYERMSSFQHWNRFAAVNYEFVDIHMDDRAGQRAGYPGAFGMGNLQWSYLHCLLRQWAGEDAVISRMSCKFRAPNLNDLRTIAHGRVIEVRTADDGSTEVDLDIWTETEEGTVMAPGSATVIIPAS